MKKIFLLLLILVVTMAVNSQILDSTKYSYFTHSEAYQHAKYGGKEYAPNITFFGGPTAEITLGGLEFGGLAGVTWRDRFAIGGFSQWRLNRDVFYGGYAQIIINPSDPFFHIGYSVKIGTVNGQYMSIEPAMEMQMTLSDYNKLAIGVGFAYGFAAVQVRWLFGNFKPKYWRDYWTAKKFQKFEDNYPDNGYQIWSKK